MLKLDPETVLWRDGLTSYEWHCKSNMESEFYC